MQVPGKIDHTGLARTRLEKARALLDEGSHSAFFEEVAFSVKNYISHKLDISLSDLTKSRVRTVLENHQLDRRHIEQVKDLLDQCDLALYAHITQPEKMETVYEHAVEVITVLEEFFNEK